MRKRFEDKSVLITGATGGIGQAAIQKFAQEGAIIIAADINRNTLKNIKSETNCRQFHILDGDLSDPDYCMQLPYSAYAVDGQLDVVINNAGLMRRGNILETSNEDWTAVMNINVDALFYVCRSTIKILQKNGGGAIVNTASCWGLYPGPEHLAYCTSKAAVAAMTQCLGRDHAQDGIRINAVCPNEVNTPMLRTGFKIRGLNPDTAIDSLNKSIPIGRIAEPEDIADVMTFLASDDARYICGTLLEVNGAKPVY